MMDMAHSPRLWLLLACSLVLSAPAFAGPPEGWSQFAGGPHRPGITLDAISLDGEPLWVQRHDVSGAIITFNPQAGVVVAAHRVYATGRVSVPGSPPNQARLFCFHATTGQPIWSTPISSPWLESFSTPCIDLQNGVVIHASLRTIAAYNMQTGAIAWSRVLDGNVVNASPVLTTDRPTGNRVFITDFDGFGTEATLYCINVDPFNSNLNPFLPGEVIWKTCIGGSSGNSPGYLSAAEGGQDLVYVATLGSYGSIPGSISAFRINEVGTPSPVWSTINPAPHGFFGGLTIVPAKTDKPPYIYAASYAFYGGIDGANMVKVDANTGVLQWSVPSNRTNSIPIVLPQGQIVLSSGIDSDGSGRSLELFLDQGEHATRVWNSALSTWIDADDDGNLDSNEFEPFGGWSTQPVISLAESSPVVAAGLTSNANLVLGACERLDLLDLSRPPGDVRFRRYQAQNVGASPAVWAGILFTTGERGLVAFGPHPAQYDVNMDGRESIEDLYSWERCEGMRDVNFDGEVSQLDRLALLQHIRASERGDLEVGR